MGQANRSLSQNKLVTQNWDIVGMQNVVATYTDDSIARH